METRDIFRAGGGPEGDCFEERKHLKMEERQDTFHYTYSARQQSEIEQIRSKYLPPEENKMDQLRRLDRSATQKGTAFSIAMGVVGCLLLGVGMCCTMVWVDLFAVGIVVGVIGILVIAAAYPVYTRITRRERARLAPRILKLTEELSGQEPGGGAPDGAPADRKRP